MAGFKEFDCPNATDRKRIRINKKLMRLNTTSAITQAGGYEHDPLTYMVIMIDTEARKIKLRMASAGTKGSWPVQTQRFVRITQEVIDAFNVDLPEFEIFMEQDSRGWWHGDISTAHTFVRSNRKE